MIGPEPRVPPISPPPSLSEWSGGLPLDGANTLCAPPSLHLSGDG